MNRVSTGLWEIRQVTFSLILIVVIFGGVRWVSGQSAQSRAASILITYDQVALQRANTENPIQLRRDAVAVIGAGDTIITNSRGRALIRLEDSIDVLIMPDTTLEIIDLSLDGDIPQIQLSVEGNLIIDEPERDPTPKILVETERLTITAQGKIGIWTDFDSSDVVTVVESGTLYTTRTGASGLLNAGEGMLVDELGTNVVPLNERSPFLHAAQLIAALRGCPATVVRTGGLALNVRVAPGLENIPIGYVEENAPVSIMGVIEAGSWYRVQRFSGFGWMRSIYLDGDCTDLRTYPNTSVERNLNLPELQPTEYELIQPFFGTPATNPWVYRTFRESPYGEE